MFLARPAALAALAAGLAACSSKTPPRTEAPARPVRTAKAEQRDVPEFLLAFGTLVSPANVDVKPQVSGRIVAVHVREGQEVTNGAVLFSIDPRDYQAAFCKAEAQLASDEAELRKKRDTLQRNEKLLQSRLVSQETFDGYRTDVAAAEAAVRMACAALEQARLNLEYCSVTALTNGVAGRRQVDVGAYVGAGSPTLINLKMVNPLYVDFSVPEKELGRVRDALAAGEVKTWITVRGQTNAHEATLALVENSVDNTTGTIALRAVAPNEDRALWPGQFVDVRLVLGTHRGAILVPAAAVQNGQNGPYLFAVTAQNTADLRLVKIGQQDAGWIIVREGVQAGEPVVTVGQMGLSPGVAIMDLDRVGAGPAR
jgi:multidrug efflux system membrane fusion protein